MHCSQSRCRHKLLSAISSGDLALQVFLSLDGSSARWSFRAPKESQNRCGNRSNMLSEHAWETRQEPEKIQRLSLGGSETDLQSQSSNKAALETTTEPFARYPASTLKAKLYTLMCETVWTNCSTCRPLRLYHYNPALQKFSRVLEHVLLVGNEIFSNVFNAAGRWCSACCGHATGLMHGCTDIKAKILVTKACKFLCLQGAWRSIVHCVNVDL